MRCKWFGFMLLSAAFCSRLVIPEVMAHGWMAPQEAAEMKTPIALEAESVRKGREIYLDKCAACHGDNAEGLEVGETGLEMETPNLKQRLKTHSDGDFFWKINEGRGQMPSFKDELSDEEKWYIIN